MSRRDRSRQGRERTAEERERDRQERERRRAGGTAAEAAPDPQPPAVPDGARAAPVHGEPAAGAPPEDAPEPPPAEPAAGEEDRWPPPIDPAAHAEPERAPAQPEPFAPEPIADEPEATAPEPEAVAPEPEAAEPEPEPERAALLPPAPRRPAMISPSAAGARAGEPRSGRSPLARLVAVAGIIVVLAALAFLLSRALKGTPHVKAPPALVVVRVLVTEGKTRAQIAEVAAAKGLTGSYLLATRKSAQLDPRKYGAPAGTPDLEGFLFPATYEVYAHAPVARLVEEQLEAFTENFGQQGITRARALHETPYALLTVASLVEREAVVPSDRPKIAAVIYNRLRAGMPIGIDASIYYAVELRDHVSTYTGELTESDLHIDSPYNTRTHTGLPPTPIANPGLAAIQAAEHPAHVSYLYYVAGADGCGEQVFSTSEAQFEANVAAYNDAVTANGGHPPKCKRR